MKSKLKRSSVSLRAEYHLLNTLSSVPNIYYPIEFRSTESTEYLVFEDFGGINLRKYLQTMGPFKNSLNMFYDLAINIITILEKIHERHVIHKELKPENIIWNASTNEVKISTYSNSHYNNIQSRVWFRSYLFPSERFQQYVQLQGSRFRYHVPKILLKLSNILALNFPRL